MAEEDENPDAFLEHEKEAKEQSDRIVGEMIEQFKKSYVPAKSQYEADLSLTTDEIYVRMQQHFRSNHYNPGDLTPILEDYGYTYRVIEGRWVWLLKEA